MSFGAGFGAGMGSGMGAGIAVGIASGKRQSREKLEAYLLEQDLMICNASGKPQDTTTVLDAALADRDCGKSRWPVALLVVGLLGLLAAIAVYALRFAG